MISLRTFLIFIMSFKIVLGFSQDENNTVDLPLVEINKSEFTSIIDSIFSTEKKCYYYSDSLSMIIRIIVNPEDSSMFSFDFETTLCILKTKDITPAAYFYHENHLCLLYFKVPNTIFSNTNTTKRFYTDKPSRFCNKKDYEYFEDDSFSQWRYYFYENKFHSYSYSSHCK